MNPQHRRAAAGDEHPLRRAQRRGRDVRARQRGRAVVGRLHRRGARPQGRRVCCRGARPPRPARRSSRRSARRSSTRCGMSPNLVGTRADRDIPLPANVRRYYSPSVRHGGGPGGFNADVPVDAAACWPPNPNPSSDIEPRADARAGGLGGEGRAAAAQPLPAARSRRPGAAHAGGDRASRSSPACRCPTACSCRSTSTTSAPASATPTCRA